MALSQQAERLLLSALGLPETADEVIAAINDGINSSPSNNPSFTGDVTYGNYHLEPSEHNAGNSGVAVTIDLSTASVQKLTLTGNTTITLTNPQTGGAYLFKILTGAGSFTVTWPGSVLWSGGTPPTITATAAKTDLINLYWDGTNYYGSFTQNY